MAAEAKKYLDLTGLGQLISKLRANKELVVHPTVSAQTAAAVKVGRDANGHVELGAALQFSDIGGSVNYNTQVTNKPTIGSGVLTIKAGNSAESASSKGTFSANATSNAEIVITASDLGLSGAMHFKGVFETLPATTNYIEGDVVVVGSKEYVLALNGASGAKKWNELGDESSHALKTVQISGDGTYITGGGTLESNRTLSHKTYAETTPAAVAVGRDTGGHVKLGGQIKVKSSEGAHTHSVTSSIPANSFLTAVSATVTKLAATSTSADFISGITAAQAKLATTSIRGVSGSVTASKATAGSGISVAQRSANQTSVVTGFASAVYSASYTTGGVLELTAVTPSTESIWTVGNTTSITPYTFADVTVPVAATDATVVATGKTAASDANGATIATGLNSPTKASAVTSVGLDSGVTTGVSVATGVGTTKNSAVSISGSAGESGAHNHSIVVEA